MNKRLLNWLTLLFFAYLIYAAVEERKKNKPIVSSYSNIPPDAKYAVTIDPDKKPEDYTLLESLASYLYKDEIERAKSIAFSAKTAELGDSLILYIEGRDDLVVYLNEQDINYKNLLGMKIGEFRLIIDYKEDSKKISARLKRLIKNNRQVDENK